MGVALDLVIVLAPVGLIAVLAIRGRRGPPPTGPPLPEPPSVVAPPDGPSSADRARQGGDQPTP